MSTFVKNLQVFRHEIRQKYLFCKKERKISKASGKSKNACALEQGCQTSLQIMLYCIHNSRINPLKLKTLKILFKKKTTQLSTLINLHFLQNSFWDQSFHLNAQSILKSTNSPNVKSLDGK